MTVTIYILNKNYKKYVRQSIESVISQTFKVDELIVFDDNSTDGSKEYLRELSIELNFKYIEKNQDFGLINLANEAIKMCKSKYIIRLDADDYLESNAIELLIMQAEQNKADLVFGNYLEITEDGNIIKKVIRHNFNNEVLLRDEPAHGAVTLISMKFLQLIKGYNNRFNCQDGYYLWLNAIKYSARIANITDIIFSYRKHFNNLTKNETYLFSTRRKIKLSFVEPSIINNSSLVISFIRGSLAEIESFWLKKVNDVFFLEFILNKILSEKCVSKVVIVFDGEDQLQLVKEKLNISNCEFFVRPKIIDDYNLNHVIFELLKNEYFDKFNFDYIINYNLNFPLFTNGVFDEIICNHVIFNANSVISARYDSKQSFCHNGNSLIPINMNNNLLLKESNIIYRHVGGIISTRYIDFMESKLLLGKIISHVIADDYSSFEVNSEFSFKIALDHISKLC